MNKKFLILTCALSVSFCGNINAQTIKTGDGESSIIVGETLIGLDITDPKITFNTNNFRRISDKKSGILWGVSLAAKNSEGAGALFNSSELANGFSAGVKIGWFNSTNDDIINSYKPEKWYILRAELRIKENSIEDNLSKYKKLFLDTIDSTQVLSSTGKESLTAKVNGIFKPPYLVPYASLKREMEKVVENQNSSQPEKIAASKIINQIENYNTLNEANKLRDQLNNLTKESLEKVKKVAFQQFNFYNFAKVNFSEFHTFTAWDSSSPGDSFEDKEFLGFEIGIGSNYRYKGKYFFGGKIYYEHANNISALTKLNFKHFEDNSFGTGTTYRLTKKDITAFSGDYGKLGLGRLDLDVATYIEINKKSYVIANAYTRLIKSFDDELLPSTADIGLSFSGYKSDGNFLGGFYIQIPDIKQNLERRKQEPELEKWYNRLGIGFYTKVSFDQLKTLPVFR